MEKEDLPLYVRWVNDPRFFGEYNPLEQTTKTEMEKNYDNAPPEKRKFFIEKKDGTKIGFIAHFAAHSTGIAYALLPNERGKGFGGEAVKIMVDYLFLSKNIVRIQAETHPQNTASQRVLERAGLKKEGIIRQSFFSRGIWRDTVMFSILREEWKEPKILTRTT